LVVLLVVTNEEEQNLVPAVTHIHLQCIKQSNTFPYRTCPANGTQLWF